MKTATQTKQAKAKEPEKDLAVSYNEFKEFEGRRYTGMKIGRSHKWYYDQGEWKEKKITPDKWEFNYAVTKRRAGKAPEGSGVPVGTEYHWYIVAHQNVRKLNANDYTTAMSGLKFKVAHRRADTGKWSASENAQRRRMIKILEELIQDLSRPAPETTEQPSEPEKKPAAKTANGANGRGNGRAHGKSLHTGNGRAAGSARTRRGQATPAGDGAAHAPSADGKTRGRRTTRV